MLRGDSSDIFYIPFDDLIDCLFIDIQTKSRLDLYFDSDSGAFAIYGMSKRCKKQHLKHNDAQYYK